MALADACKVCTLAHGQVIFDSRHWVCREAEMTWQAPRHVIILTETGTTSATRIRSSGSRTYEGTDRPGSITVVPAGIEREGGYHDADLVYSALWIDPEAGLPGTEAFANMPMLVNVSDDVTRTLIRSLSASIVMDETPEPLYVEQLTSLVMLRLSGKTPAPATARQRGLSKRQLARIDSHIEGRLNEGISLGDLAALCGMPIDTFARRFKASTGNAPYAYVIEARLRRAEDLLRQGQLSLADIALEAGFSSQSHFTSTFTQRNGVSPSAYRQSFRARTFLQ